MNQSYRDFKLRHGHNDSLHPSLGKAFQSYEDYLHQRSRYHRRHHDESQTQHYHNIKYKYTGQVPSQHYKIKEPELKAQTKYYPIEKKIVQYIDKQIKQIVPKKKVITEYRQRKQIEVVAKEIVRKDYYAVEHVRSYVKEVVPEKVIEQVKVPKIIKSQISVPVSKQIIYYPDNSQLTLEEKKVKARAYLNGEGVQIRQDVEYRPISQKRDHQRFSPRITKTLEPQKYSPQKTYLHDSPSKSIYKPIPLQSRYLQEPKTSTPIYLQKHQRQQQKYTLSCKATHHILNNDTHSEVLIPQHDTFSYRKTALEDPPLYKQQNYGGYIKNSYSEYLKNLLTEQNLSKYKKVNNNSLDRQDVSKKQTPYKSQLINDSYWANKQKSSKKYWIK